jgi:tetratricopeptide (TPR) repeat protein
MVSCHQCSAPNSLDSTFCKRCGTALAESDLQDAQEKVAEWIAEGNIAFGDGRIEEAMAISDSALESNPNYVEALILKSLCYERLGNIPEALIYAEKVVEINPDSELDKIRRNGLRMALGNSLHVPESSDRRAPLIAGLAAVLAVLSLGATVVHFMNSRQVVARAAPITSDQPATFGGFSQPRYSIPSTTQTQPLTNNPVQNPSQPVQTSPQDSQNSDAQPPLDRVNSRDSLPISPPVTLVPDGNVQALNPSSAVGQQNGQQSTPVPNGQADPPPSADGPAVPQTPINTPPATVPTPKAEEDPGQISITVHKGPSRNFGGSQSVGDSNISSNGVQALSRTGYQQFMVGSFSAAAASFEKALRGGGDPIRLNQRLGQAYTKLGRTSDAISAYSRAVEACQQALQSGKGDKANIQATLDSCQQATKVLGG